MLALERSPNLNGRANIMGHASELLPSIERNDDELAYHLMLILEEKWLVGVYVRISGQFLLERLTKDGHDFIDATRDRGIWDKAKSRASDAGGATLGFVWEIAKTLIRNEITKHIGPLLP